MPASYDLVEYPLAASDSKGWRVQLSWRWRGLGPGDGRATLRCGSQVQTVRQLGEAWARGNIRVRTIGSLPRL